MSGVSNLGKGINSINRLRSTIRDLPLRIRSAVAKDAEAVLNDYVREDFDSGVTVYGQPRPTSKASAHPGAPLSLKKSGKTRAALGFVAVGTIVRAQLGMRYARFLVGKYQILPQRLPAKWAEALEKIVAEFRADIAQEAARK